MKYIVVIGYFLVCSFNVIGQKSVESEILVNKVTTALKLQNVDSMMDCILEKRELKILLEKGLKHNPGMILPSAEEIHYSIIEAAKSNFQLILDSGRINSINWGLLKVIDFNIEMETNESAEIEKGDIYIKYSDGNTPFKVKLVDCTKIDDEWKLMERFWWYGKEQH